jgi:hypothetical protein
MELQVTSNVIGFNWLHIFVGGGCEVGDDYKWQNIFAVFLAHIFAAKFSA